MELNFRKLIASEIDVRIGTLKEGSGCSLLLYKDARVDMDILDETVGPLGWKREHLRDNQNCVVSIYDADRRVWVSKEDTGVESYNDGSGNCKKGLASDSFKRACVNWGIGRELYTSPFIWFKAEEIKSKYDRFICLDIKYEGNSISEVTILNKTTQVQKVFKNIAIPVAKEPKTPAAALEDNAKEVTTITKLVTDYGFEESLKKILDFFKVKSLSELNKVQLAQVYSKVAEEAKKEEEAKKSANEAKKASRTEDMEVSPDETDEVPFQ